MKLKFINTFKDPMLTPKYATKGSSGFDLVTPEGFKLFPGATRVVDTGLAFEIPVGYEIQIRPRSGLAINKNVTVFFLGTIDSDYRGTIHIMMENRGETTVTIEKYSRIAQGVVCPVSQVEFEPVDKLEETERGSGKFGSTGIGILA